MFPGTERVICAAQIFLLKLPRGFCGVSFRRLITRLIELVPSRAGFLMEDCSEDWNREAFSKGHVCGPRSDVRQSWPARLGWLAFCGTKLRVTPGKKLLPPLLGSASCPGNIPCLHPSERISPYRRNRINIVRMSCRPICLPSRNRRREEEGEERVKIGVMGVSRWRDIAKGSCRSRSIRKGSAMHTGQIRFV